MFKIKVLVMSNFQRNYHSLPELRVLEKLSIKLINSKPNK